MLANLSAARPLHGKNFTYFLKKFGEFKKLSYICTPKTRNAGFV